MIRAAAWILVCVAAATAQPATQPATPTTSPDDPPATQPAAEPEVEKALDAMEAAGKKFTTLTADVRYIDEEVMFGERTTYSGQVYYQRMGEGKGPARFRIHFDKVRAGGTTTKADRDYAFVTNRKGQWLITRNAVTKQLVEYHVARPGEATDPLELGKGPFPVPFGQRKVLVLKLFTVTCRPRNDTDPKGAATYLELVPRKQFRDRFKVKKIELWVRADGLPIRIRSSSADGETIRTAAFTKIATDAKLTDKDFHLPRPPRGWEHRIEPLPKQVAPPSAPKPGLGETP